MKDKLTQFLDEHVHVWLDIQLDFGQSDLHMLSSCVLYFLYHLTHSCIRQTLFHLLQVIHFVGARQQDVKTAVTSESKPRHLFVK